VLAGVQGNYSIGIITNDMVTAKGSVLDEILLLLWSVPDRQLQTRRNHVHLRLSNSRLCSLSAAF
jgi:hypothetical protein